MAAIKYTATKLKSLNKQGIMKPDANGYYTLVIGGLNVLNSAGELYTLNGAKDLFDKSSILQRRIKNGNLFGELGHPKRLPGMSDQDFINRILRVEETNICAHFAEIWLDESYGRSRPELRNDKAVAIMAKVAPAGPHASVLKAALENREQNVCFSVRGLTTDAFIRGINHRTLNNILTWDCVTEPGISIANKWDSPALETLDTMYLTRQAVETALKAPMGMSMESQSLFAKDVLSVFKDTAESKKTYQNW